MANQDHIGSLTAGSEGINRARAALPPGAVLEFTEANLSDLRLHGLNLSQAIFSGANLAGVDLSSAHLHNANFAGANLSGSNLSDADCNSANFRSADLRGATVTSRTIFKSAVFQEAKFDVELIHRANMKGANLVSLDLTGIDLSGCDLSEAIIQSADLSGAVLSDARLIKTDLRSSFLRQTIFHKADLSGAICVASDLSGADLTGAKLERADLSLARLNGAIIRRTDFYEANLNQASMERVVGARPAQNLLTAQTERVLYFETAVRDWPERWLDWEAIRIVGRLPLFGASYTGLILIPAYVYFLQIYNDKIEAARAWIAHTAGTSNGIPGAAGNAVLDHLHPETVPDSFFWLFLSTFCLAVASTIYAGVCPSRIKEFSRDQWCDELGHSLVHYWPEAWKWRTARLVCAALYAAGATGAVLAIGPKLWRTAVVLFQSEFLL
jgi:uncharacterized protein YjbI with pentapeptide repeats